MPKLLKSLNINDKVKYGKHQVNTETPEVIVWKIAAKNHSCVPAYPSNSVTLVANEIIDKRSFDDVEPSNPDRNAAELGNNRYSQSNIAQWLNSTAKNWYTPQHEYDAPPNNPSIKTSYAHRDGFLFNFSQKEVEKILDTKIRITLSSEIGGDYEDITTKMFLPSNSEMGFIDEYNTVEGSKWEIWTNDESKKCYNSQQLFSNTLSTVVSTLKTDPDVYWLRTPLPLNTFCASEVNETPSQYYLSCVIGDIGVMPAFNLSENLLVSDTPDAEGCYSIIFDEAPTINASPAGDLGHLTTPLKQIYTIFDADNDNLTVTEKLNGTIIRTLTSQVSNTTLTFDLSSISHALKENQTHTATIELTDGILTTLHTWTFTYTNAAPSLNAPPSGSLGKFTLPVNQVYTIADANNDPLTVIEKLNGNIIRNLTNQESGKKLFYDLSTHWDALERDSLHTATIEVSDGSLVDSRTWSFTKKYLEPMVRETIPNEADNRPTGIIVREISNAASQFAVQVLVTNNALDEDPVWEDATLSYISKREHTFRNETKTSDKWATSVKHIITCYPANADITVITEMKF